MLRAIAASIAIAFPCTAMADACLMLPSTITLENKVTITRLNKTIYAVTKTPPILSPEIAEKIAKNNEYANKISGIDPSNPNSTVQLAIQEQKKLQMALLANMKTLIEITQDTSDPYQEEKISRIKAEQSSITQAISNLNQIIQSSTRNAELISEALNSPLYPKLKIGNTTFTDDEFYITSGVKNFIFKKVSFHKYGCSEIT